MLFVYNLRANLILKICGIRILFTLSSVVEPRLDIHILQRLENHGSNLPVLAVVRNKHVEMFLSVILMGTLFCLTLQLFLQQFGGIHKNLLHLLVSREILPF